jgi:hypothetical protein
MKKKSFQIYERGESNKKSVLSKEKGGIYLFPRKPDK